MNKRLTQQTAQKEVFERIGKKIIKIVMAKEFSKISFFGKYLAKPIGSGFALKRSVVQIFNI